MNKSDALNLHASYLLEKQAMTKKIMTTLLILMFLTGCAGKIPNLGVKKGKLTPCPQKQNCVSSQAVDEKQHIQPILYLGNQNDAKDHLLRLLDSMKRTKIVTANADYIRAEFTSALFRFVDDVEFYLPDGQADETVIHVRSASRIGRSDLGVNRKRVEEIRSHFAK